MLKQPVVDTCTGALTKLPAFCALQSIDVPAFVELALTPGPEVASGKMCLS